MDKSFKKLYERVQKIDQTDDREKSVEVKALKLMEEVGELARALVERAGYKLRPEFDSKESLHNNLGIESVDVIIMGLVILSHLEFTGDEVEKMFWGQIEKWQHGIKKNKKESEEKSKLKLIEELSVDFDFKSWEKAALKHPEHSFIGTLQDAFNDATEKYHTGPSKIDSIYLVFFTDDSGYNRIIYATDKAKEDFYKHINILE